MSNDFAGVRGMTSAEFRSVLRERDHERTMRRMTWTNRALNALFVALVAFLAFSLGADRAVRLCVSYPATCAALVHKNGPP